MAGNSNWQHIVLFNLTLEFNLNGERWKCWIMGQLIRIMLLCLISWGFTEAISWQPNWTNLRFHTQRQQHVNMFIAILSLISCYENGWYSMAMLDYLRLNRVDHVQVHTHQMFAPLRKWRGDKKISSSGMSSARTASQNPVFISRSRNDDLRWKMLLIAIS